MDMNKAILSRLTLDFYLENKLAYEESSDVYAETGTTFSRYHNIPHLWVRWRMTATWAKLQIKE